MKQMKQLACACYLRLWAAQAELDEKALLIAMFVIAAIVGLAALGKEAIPLKYLKLAEFLNRH